jgi:hypothetical protein
MFDGMIMSLMREKNSCVVGLRSKLSTQNEESLSETKPTRVQMQVDAGWIPGTHLRLVCGGVQFEVPPPRDTQVGDWLEFDSESRTLTKLNR